VGACESEDELKRHHLGSQEDRGCC